MRWPHHVLAIMLWFTLFAATIRIAAAQRSARSQEHRDSQCRNGWAHCVHSAMSFMGAAVEMITGTGYAAGRRDHMGCNPTAGGRRSALLA